MKISGRQHTSPMKMHSHIKRIPLAFILTILLIQFSCKEADNFKVLDNSYFLEYVVEFNRNDKELYQQFVPNDSAYAFLSENIPIIEIPKKYIEFIQRFATIRFISDVA